MYDVEKIRQDFPILSREVHGKPLVYLDNGASAQKPQVVIDAVTKAYGEEYSNVHRGLHFLSNLATENYEAVREKLRAFLNAEKQEEILFTTGSTEGFNLISYGWAAPQLQAGDEIILSVMEHHANIVPWHFLRERQGVVLKWVDVDATGALDPQAVIDAITPKTKLIALTHVSNVLGAAIDYMTNLGMENIAAHEASLRDYAVEKFSGLNWLNIQGTTPEKAAIFSFTIEGAGHAHDISTVVDRKGVAVRAGHHCAQPLMDHLGVSATCRASFGLYNTKAEVDVLVEALELCHELFS